MKMSRNLFGYLINRGAKVLLILGVIEVYLLVGYFVSGPLGVNPNFGYVGKIVGGSIMLALIILVAVFIFCIISEIYIDYKKWIQKEEVA